MRLSDSMIYFVDKKLMQHGDEDENQAITFNTGNILKKHDCTSVVVKMIFDEIKSNIMTLLM